MLCKMKYAESHISSSIIYFLDCHCHDRFSTILLIKKLQGLRQSPPSQPHSSLLYSGDSSHSPSPMYLICTKWTKSVRETIICELLLVKHLVR